MPHMEQVELVSTTSSDGVQLDGSLTRPTSPPNPTFDAAILHHGVGSNFYNASFFAHMQRALTEAGVAVLRVNNRGHDLAYNSPKGRLGAAFEVVDDCRHDWKAWIDFAETRGFGRILLWGHSLGAVKTIYYLATERDPRIRCAIASSPPLFSYSSYMAKEGAPRFVEHFQKAERFVSGGTPDELLAITIPTTALLAARTYIDKYGPQERYNILQHLPTLNVPVLVTIGGDEGRGPNAADWFPFGGLAEQVRALSEHTPQLTFTLIPGANHGYHGKETELWNALHDWSHLIGLPV